VSDKSETSNIQAAECDSHYIYFALFTAFLRILLMIFLYSINIGDLANSDFVQNNTTLQLTFRELIDYDN
jgi:hypothetical protein